MWKRISPVTALFPPCQRAAIGSLPLQRSPGAASRPGAWPAAPWMLSQSRCGGRSCGRASTVLHCTFWMRPPPGVRCPVSAPRSLSPGILWPEVPGPRRIGCSGTSTMSRPSGGSSVWMPQKPPWKASTGSSPGTSPSMWGSPSVPPAASIAALSPPQRRNPES